MDDEREAVRLILDRLKDDGLNWYRRARSTELGAYEGGLPGNFAVLETGEHHAVAKQPKGQLPAKKILVLRPSGIVGEEVLGLWLRWDFDDTPFAFRLFIGQWATIAGQKTFSAFRFEAPEKGDKHNYYHCQPCRNFGDREQVPNAALVSDHFPTIPINASNIVELTVCALMACMGHQQLKGFFRKLLTSSAADNRPLKAAFARVLPAPA